MKTSEAQMQNCIFADCIKAKVFRICNTSNMNGDMSNIAFGSQFACWAILAMLVNQFIEKFGGLVWIKKVLGIERILILIQIATKKTILNMAGSPFACHPSEKRNWGWRVWIQFHVHTECHFPGYREDMFVGLFVCLKEENGFSPRHKVFLSRQASKLWPFQLKMPTSLFLKKSAAHLQL